MSKTDVDSVHAQDPAVPRGRLLFALDATYSR